MTLSDIAKNRKQRKKLIALASMGKQNEVSGT